MPKTKTTSQTLKPIHEILEERKLIGHLWAIEDVLELRPDLNPDQAWQVLQRVDDLKDANYGISWDHLQIAADELFPVPEEEGA